MAAGTLPRIDVSAVPQLHPVELLNHQRLFGISRLLIFRRHFHEFWKLGGAEVRRERVGNLLLMLLWKLFQLVAWRVNQLNLLPAASRQQRGDKRGLARISRSRVHGLRKAAMKRHVGEARLLGSMYVPPRLVNEGLGTIVRPPCVPLRRACRSERRLS